MKNNGNRQSFFKRHFKALATAGIIAIPTIYTSFFLGSMWDPYGKTENLPVAVVNNDVPVEYNDAILNIGENLVKNLEENNSLAFNFVDGDIAEKGLENGTYYMVITIPENFSANAATVMDDEPQKMVLSYAVNPGTNYIASKMSESAMTKLQKSIQESVVEEYTNTVFEQLGTIGSGMDEAAEGAGRLREGSGKLSDGTDMISENLKLLADSTVTFEEGITAFRDGLKEYTGGVSDVDAGASKLSDGAVTLKNGTAALSEGSKTLSGGLKTYTDGVESADEGVLKLLDGSAVIHGGLSELYNGSVNLAEGISAYTSGVSSLNDGAYELSEGAAQLKIGSSSLLGGLNALASALDSSLSEKNKSDMGTVRNGLTALNSGIQDLNTALKSSDTSMDMTPLMTVMNNSLTGIGNDAKSIGTELENLKKTVTSLMQSEAFRALPAEQQAALSKQMTEILQNMAASTSDIGTNVKAVSDAVTEADLDTKMETLNTSMASLKASVSVIADNSGKLLPAAEGTIGSLSEGLSNVQNALERRGESAADSGIIQGAEAIENGAVKLQKGSEALYSGSSQLVANNASLTSGAGMIAGGSSQLCSGSAELNSGLDILKNGTSELVSNNAVLLKGMETVSAGAASLDSGAGELRNGIDTLKNGTEKLVSNNDKLMDGSNDLYDGSVKLTDGSSRLYDGSLELSDGVSELFEGCGTLESSLYDGAEEINSTNTAEKNAQMFSSPVDIEETVLTNPKNNGQAMSAYMMSVGLWVGCLAYCLMFSPDEAVKEKKITRKNAVHFWLQEMAKVLAVAAVQAVVMVFALSAVLGFEPASAFRTVTVACMSSMAFMMLFYFFNILMGKIGSFILLVFMVLQLSGSAGTYPIELSDGFFQKLHPFMPFTYTVNAFRSTIASGLDISTEVRILCGILVVFYALNCAAVYFRAAASEENNSAEYEATAV